ncbi:reverse transcriptase [Gossypium australe]|uniref:Reverse transcriptase n=1 Tax=Gossypium australe TaxID=47621 RepID=A0A5B6WSR9_9ROSI|nr:reverse transcriptase [Gossypium australe]
MPRNKELQHFILREAHNSPYAMHLRSNKMYQKYLIFQKVKVEHQYPSGLLSPFKIPKWKWEKITMDFVSDLPLTVTKKDVIWSNISVRRHVAKLCFEVRMKLERYLTLIEFAYNNSYQASIQMAPFEEVYGRRCQTPLCWAELDGK